MPTKRYPVLALMSVLTISLIGTRAAAQSESGSTIASFAIGRGKKPAKVAVDVQRNLRKIIATTGFKNVDLRALLEQGTTSDRQEAIEEAQRLVEEGKAAYEQLDLEVAQQNFQLARKKFEYGYGYLDKQALLLECLMYLGATWVLVGEPEKATRVFMRAQELPGRKVLDPNLFPPNIQEVFNDAKARAESAPQGRVTLLSAPLGAEIHLNGTYRGGSPLLINELRAGVHLVRATKDGYQPWGGRIKAVGGKKRNLKINLKPAAKHQAFSSRFRPMVAEVMKGEPGKAASELAGFLKADRLAVVTLSGSPNAMTFQGYLCDTTGEIKVASKQEVLDTTGPEFDSQLNSFLRNLLASSAGAGSEPVASGEEDEGAAAAAALLAGADSTEVGSSEGLGLDLGDGETEGKTGTGTEESPVKEGDAVADASADVSAEVKAEEDKEAEEAKKTIEETKPGKPEERKSTMVWYKEWWFWTAVGVVAAGAATGTYFLVSSSGGSDSGSLVLDLH